MYKRGISGIVVALILILLSLVAAGIVWAVIKNILTKETEEISLGKFLIDLEIEKAYFGGNGIIVNIKRNVGGGDLTGINFIVSDGENSKVIKRKINLQELGKSNFNLSQQEFEGLGFIKEVSIAPIVKLESGKESEGNIVDTKEVSAKEFLVSLGAVSWWRLNGNAKDEIGGNSGTLQGGVNCDIPGKFSKSCEFFQEDEGGNYREDYIELSSPIQYDIPWTVCSWVYLKQNFPDRAHVFLDDSDGESADLYSLRFSMHNNTKAGFTDYLVQDYYLNYEFPIKEWKFACYIGNLSGVYLYVDGQFKDKNPDIIKLPVKYVAHSPLRSNVTSGTPHGTIGIIDEIMIFDKDLSSENVESLYKLMN